MDDEETLTNSGKDTAERVLHAWHPLLLLRELVVLPHLTHSQSPQIFYLWQRKQDTDSCLYLKAISQKPEVEKPMSQTDQGDHSQEVEELTEDKAGEINVISED